MIGWLLEAAAALRQVSRPRPLFFGAGPRPAPPPPLPLADVMQQQRGSWDSYYFIFFHWSFQCVPPPGRLLQQRYDLPPSVSLLVRGAKAGSTNEVAGNSLNQPITMLDKSRSSNRI